MPQDLQNSIVALVQSVDAEGNKGYATYSCLFNVIVFLVLWNKQTGNNIQNRNAVSDFMHNYLSRHYRNLIPMPNVNTITNRFMREIDKTIHDLYNTPQSSTLSHIN